MAEQKTVEKKNTEISVVESWSNAISNELNNISEALPQNFNKSRFTQNVLTLMNDKPEIFRNHNGAEIMDGLMRGARYDVDFMSKECYLIEWGGKLQFHFDYTGLQKVAKKYSIRPIKDIIANVVREGDDFSVGIKDNVPVINFSPKVFGNGKIVGAFAYVIYEDGGIVYETMSLEDLETVHRQSKAQNSPAWKNFPDRMYRKAVIRRLIRSQVKLDFENVYQTEHFYDDDAMVETPEDVIDSVAVEVEENANQIPFNPED